MEKLCIVNSENKAVTDVLEQYGYVCIPTQKSECVSEPIALHADVLYLKSENNKIFVSSCQNDNIDMLKQRGYNIEAVKLAPGYKTECLLNMIITENNVICNPKTCMDLSLLQSRKEIIEVKQGYTRCSTIALNSDNFITEDEGIYSVLSKKGKNCLLIEKGYVRLDGYDYGFIGGASVYLKENSTLLFSGDISVHPDFERIKIFCKNINVTTDYIDNMELTEIGGVVFF